MGRQFFKDKIELKSIINNNYIQIRKVEIDIVMVLKKKD